jgi:hypothetical protein
VRSIAAYLTERFPSRVFVPAIALHASAAWWAAGVTRLGPVDSPWRSFGAALGVMTLLFMQFRLWDDLEDLDRDRATHPDRVLVASRRRPFQVLLVMLTAAAGFALAARGRALFAFGILCVVFLGAYRFVRPRVADAHWRYGVLLLKYPAFVGVVALGLGRPDASRLVAAALAAYLVTSLYEAWHHDRHVGLGVVR